MPRAIRPCFNEDETLAVLHALGSRFSSIVDAGKRYAEIDDAVTVLRAALRIQRVAWSSAGMCWPRLLGGPEQDAGLTPGRITPATVRKKLGWS